MQDLQQDRPDQVGRLILFAEHSGSDASAGVDDAAQPSSASQTRRKRPVRHQPRPSRRPLNQRNKKFSEDALKATEKLTSSYRRHLMAIAVAKADDRRLTTVDAIHVEEAFFVMRAPVINAKRKLIAMMPGTLIGIGGASLVSLLLNQEFSGPYVLVSATITAVGAFLAGLEAKS